MIVYLLCVSLWDDYCGSNIFLVFHTIYLIAGGYGCVKADGRK
jgi:hypothetical protein